ncbi:AI-2E family transporter [Bombella pollinis]|uniref:AI-2E family transporter n=1 Tax=Bombella pollinis TaxID=2967337 RepID=A0ABT3WKY8_9PROT|nr:AI-2E family transporter [Bombella pollinis]MCX5618840.1 AI-2E family transporter [Bombella pollinis]
MITRLKSFFTQPEANFQGQQAEGQLKPVLTALTVGTLLLAALWVLKPFLLPILGAITISVTFWPFVLKLHKLLFGSRVAAVFCTALAALIVFFMPVALIALIFAQHVKDVSHLISILPSWQLPAVPAWVGHIPHLGSHIVPLWDHLRENSLPSLLKQIIPPPETLISMVLSSAGSFGSLLVEFGLTLIAMVIILLHAEKLIDVLERISVRLAGEAGRHFLKRAEITMRGVALGVTLTAIVESLFGWLGLMLAGMPMGSVIAAVMFISCVLQFGGAWVLFASTIWLYFTAPLSHALILLVFALIAVANDNFLQALVIRRYVRISVITIMFGAFGGIATLGFAGVFVGPTLLYLVEFMLQEWVGLSPKDEAEKTSSL